MWVNVAMASTGRLVRAREGRGLESSVDSSLNRVRVEFGHTGSATLMWCDGKIMKLEKWIQRGSTCSTYHLGGSQGLDGS